MLSMEPIRRTERGRLRRMVDDYWGLRPTGGRPADDRVREKQFDDQFWNETGSRFLWWAMLDGAAIGFAKADLVEDAMWDTQGDLSEFYIAPGFRRRGYGRTFARLILDWFTGRGIKSVRLYVRQDNHAAMAFWEHLGFVTVQRWHQMRKALP